MADPTLLPAGESSPDDDLLALEDDVLGRADLEVTAAPPPPLGKTYDADFSLPDGRLFGRPPRTVRGIATLEVWIDKCLHTERGMHAIYPPGYGMVNVYGGVGEPWGSPELADREDRIRDALTFHPRVVDVQDYAADYDPDDDRFFESFRVVVDDGDDLTIRRTT